MKTTVKTTLSLTLVATLFAFVSCNNPGQQDQQQESQQQESMEDMHQDEMHQQDMADAKYTCPMHPEVVQSEPGQCPECGMDLERMDEMNDTSHMHEGHGHEGHNH